MHLGEFRRQMSHEPLIEILPAELYIAVGRESPKLFAGDFQNHHIKRASAKIVYQNTCRPSRLHRRSKKTVLVSVCYCRGSWFVNNVEHSETGQPSCILCCLAAGFVKKCGHRYNHI